jgi:hypothetical protein
VGGFLAFSETKSILLQKSPEINVLHFFEKDVITLLENC